MIAFFKKLNTLKNRKKKCNVEGSEILKDERKNSGQLKYRKCLIQHSY